MKISPIYSNFLNINPSEQNGTIIKNSAFVYNSMFSFKGSQVKPLTDKDYNKAVSNLESVKKEARARVVHSSLSLRDLDADKINGLQKGIQVFDGLTMREIAFIMRNPSLLLNRGCANNCVHCFAMATPFSKQTYDKMSFEDFKSYVDGISELQKRLGDDVKLCSPPELFLDSDCIDIEIQDKDGNIYDYVDCRDYMKKQGFAYCLFDTSGWKPTSEKLQKRAEKLVEYVIDEKKKNNKFFDDENLHVNLSVNPYHILYAKAVEEKLNNNPEKAEKLENLYVDRIANAMLTFSPLIREKCTFHILVRAAIDSHLKDKNFGRLACKDLSEKILKRLEDLYNDDLQNEKKYVKDERESKIFLSFYENALLYTQMVSPYGRAANLFKDISSEIPKSAFLREITDSKIYTTFNYSINPNGSVVMSRKDISAKTNLSLNFENKNKPVKPLANEVENVFISVTKEGPKINYED